MLMSIACVRRRRSIFVRVKTAGQLIRFMSDGLTRASTISNSLSAPNSDTLPRKELNDPLPSSGSPAGPDLRGGARHRGTTRGLHMRFGTRGVVPPPDDRGYAADVSY